MVASGWVLMIGPGLLLLDEPAAGLSPRFIDEIFERVVAINRTGVGILMVEQNARQALAIAHTGYVLATGRNRFTDTGTALLANREVAESFLGGTPALCRCRLLTRHPGESRDPFCSMELVEKWIPAFVGVTNSSTRALRPSGRRHPGESRDPFCSMKLVEKWTPAFAGVTNSSTRALRLPGRRHPAESRHPFSTIALLQKPTPPLPSVPNSSIPALR